MKLTHDVYRGKNSLLVGVFVLLALLFSSVSHSHDTPDNNTHYEQLDCKLCHSKTEPKISHFQPVSVNIGTYKVILHCTGVSLWSSPIESGFGQRAPPLF